MPSEGWFRKRSKFTDPVVGQAANIVPDGVATKCLRCGQILFTKDFEKNLKVCPQCGFHHKVSAAERLGYTVDEGSFVGIADNLSTIDVLKFPDYQAKLDKSIKATGMTDGMRFGTARIKGIPCVVGILDFFFMGGSMGAVAGEKVVRAMETGIELGLPVVLFTASGGARQQEGLVALMQMAKTVAAASLLAQNNIPYIVVMTDPTTGGVLAAFASMGDIILAEPSATIGLAGARVAAQASLHKAPADYQTSEWQLTRGQIDQIVQRRDIPATIASLLQLLGCAAVEAPADAAEERQDFDETDVDSDRTVNGKMEVAVG